MSHTPIHPKALQDFKASLHGEVIGPNDEGYESARRVWKSMLLTSSVPSSLHARKRLRWQFVQEAMTLPDTESVMTDW
jgi:hypothetical protein